MFSHTQASVQRRKSDSIQSPKTLLSRQGPHGIGWTIFSFIVPLHYELFKSQCVSQKMAVRSRHIILLHKRHIIILEQSVWTNPKIGPHQRLLF